MVSSVLVSTAHCSPQGDAGRPVGAAESWLVHGNHGLLHQRAPALALACSDSVARTIGEQGGTQLLTFSAAGDCASCSKHLGGLAELLARAPVPGMEAFVVLYANPSDFGQALATLRAYTTLPVCHDAAGALWTRLPIEYTPVTVALQRGRVAYATDVDLDTPERIGRVARDISALAARAGIDQN